jgi:gliding-associated putative ABC transporter substrate-binding component GldG
MVMSKRKYQDLSRYGIILIIAVLLNIIGSYTFFRLDLTTEKRYSLNPATIEMLEGLEDRVLFKIYLEGDFPADFKRLQRETRQMLDEFKAYQPDIEYQFVNPNEGDDDKTTREIWQQLRSKGLEALQIEQAEEGGASQIQIFPGAIASYMEREVPVQLLISQFATAPSQQINSSIEKLEFTLANAIRRLATVSKPRIAFLDGNGQLGPKYTADLGRELSQYYSVERFNLREFVLDSAGNEPTISSQLRRLNSFDALIIAKPTIPFSDLDRYLVDQFIMGGGKTLWFIDAVHAEMDSLSKAPQFLAYPVAGDLNLTDWMFRYGVRVNNNLVQDMVAGGVNDRKSINRWIYFPLIMPQVEHPITKDLNAIKLEFASTIDTIITPGVKKTILLRTSPYSRTVSAPHMVNLQTLYQEQNEAMFTQRNLPVGILLEGTFESVFKNRIIPKPESGEQISVMDKSSPTQMLVIGDGDMVRNQLNVVNPNIPRGQPLPVGYDQFTGMQYGNKDFLLNAIDYMLDDSGMINIRSRELTLRLLDFNKIRADKSYWQALNTVVPIVLVLIFGMVYTWLRRRKYARK